MNDKIHLMIDEINEMSRPELIKNRADLNADEELPRHERGKLLAAIDSRLSQFKSFEKVVDKTQNKPTNQINYSFASMERDNEKLSVVTAKTLGELVLEMEPDMVYLFHKISKTEYNQMLDFGYGEV